jgi:adenosylcobinamide-phosphate synthase
MSVELALIAVAVEAIVGYPDFLYRAIGHPVSWIGKFIEWCNEAWNSPQVSFEQRRGWGVATLVLLLMLSLVAGWTIERELPVALCGILGSSLLAQRSLHAHVAAVAEALETRGLNAARQQVAMIVGRDTDRLDAAAVARAAIESLAENFSDGVVAPLFWMAFAGLPGAIAYKAINTADSMIGHKSDKYRAFGWASARADDLLNLPASRLSALWLVLAAMLSQHCSPQRAWTAAWRDAGRHRSPNAGWPEAAMAGALGLKLAGPRIYDGSLVADAWMGDGRDEVTASDIRDALALYRTACAAQIAVLAVVVLLVSQQS